MWLKRASDALMTALLLLLIRMYRWTLSPFIGGQCRFYPTCSRYAEQAIRLHGPWRGAWLAAKRIGRCHPGHPGGPDPVPPRAEAGADRSGADVDTRVSCGACCDGEQDHHADHGASRCAGHQHPSS